MTIAQENYDRFKELRQNYYIAGRSLLVSQLFGMAGINFGYAIELSFKFLLAVKGNTLRKLSNTHDIAMLYEAAKGNFGLPALRVSDDFIDFANERLNARYPSLIADHLAGHDKSQRAYVFTIDMLHCYDDFILQLDDAISEIVGDARSLIGFRCCRDLESAKGRIFFHCNDHAFARIPRYRELLAGYRDPGDGAERLQVLLDSPEQLWNFKGLMAYRPWGPKSNWSPASEFKHSRIVDRMTAIRAAKWQANNIDTGMYLSSAEILLPPGEYLTHFGEQVVEPSERSKTGSTGNTEN